MRPNSIMENPYDYQNTTNSTTTVAIDEFDEPFWLTEPVRDPLYVVIPISVIYASIFVTGMIGNISTCIVIARNKSMHTATNYYLFSLAVSDLLLLMLGVPVEIYQVWYKYPYIFGEAFCVLRGLAAETSTNASVLTITAFTVERYVAICHPFLSQTMSKLSRAIKLILFIWMVALLSAVPQAIQVGLVAPPQRPDVLVCTLKRIIFKDSFVVASIVFFALPLLLLSVLYAMIGIKLRKSTLIKKNYKKQKSSKRTASTKVKVGSAKMDKHCRQHTKSTRRVIKMLVAVVVTFFVCWAPFHVQRLIATFQKQQQHQSQESNRRIELLYLISTYVSGIFYYFSTTVNPILYNIMSNKFREAFMETLARSCRVTRFKVQRARRSYSSLSRSQQRHPGPFPSKTTGLSLGTAVAQESTDCSGNSVRDDFRQVEYSMSDTLPGANICNGHGGEPLSSSRKDVINMEMDVCDINLSVMSLSCTPPSHRINGTNLLSTHFTDGTSRQQRSTSPNCDRSFTLHNSIPKYSHPCTVGYRTKPVESSDKKWWCLLGWLPGLKSLRTSHAITRPNQDTVVDLDHRQEQQQHHHQLQPLQQQQQQQQQQHTKDYYMQLHTFKAKDESCRPV